MSQAHRRRGRWIGSALVLAAIALGGCGDGDDGAGADRDAAAAGDWALFGRVEQRTHYLPANVNPPLKQVWVFGEQTLIEFPPALADGVLYVADKYGDVRAVRASDGEVLWRRFSGGRDFGPPTDVTAPTYADGLVFLAFFSGRVVALDSDSGNTRWSIQLPSRLESSPMVVDGTLYLGTDKGEVVALDSGSGKRRWSRELSAAPIRASISFDGGNLYAADYAGTVFCLRKGDGRTVWRTDTTRVGPRGEGGFYSSPAIAAGRVYLGRDDGTIFALDADRGSYEWSFPTDHFVYGSPAVAEVPGTELTVYVGSYDGNLYALDAKTGKQSWRYEVGGPVPGTATVIGRTVYTSSFQTKESVGIDVKTRKKVFSEESPGYTPMISDGERLYLTGYQSLHAYEPK